MAAREPRGPWGSLPRLPRLALVALLAACTGAPKDTSLDSDSGPTETGCVVEEPEEACVYRAGGYLGCGTCDSVWLCSSFNSVVEWGRAGYRCKCIAEDGYWDDDLCPRDPYE